MLGVQTIGNATLVAYDRRPVVCTDPWLGGEDDAYFGSWALSHEIPEPIRRDIFACAYVWFSHGHPDHLNPASYPRFKGKSILLPDHVGGRIVRGLREEGFDVQVLTDRTWYPLSENIRVQCITTVLQDAILLVDVAGVLFADINDSGGLGAVAHVRRVARRYEKSYLLALSGYGDANMINFYTEDGVFVPPSASAKSPVGAALSLTVKDYGLKGAIPFSSFHRYQREDCAWANAYTTPIDAYPQQFDTANLEYIAPFSYVDCASGETLQTEVSETPRAVYPASKFGDDWNEKLTPGDRDQLRDYFAKFECLGKRIGFITFRVGGQEHTIEMAGKKRVGITFEVPRTSLMTAIEWEIFDDLLIGNFMKTTLHGLATLFDKDVSALVAKYGDNGRAFSEAEVAAYLAEYKARCGAQLVRDMLMSKTADLAKRVIRNKNGYPFRVARRMYFLLKS